MMFIVRQVALKADGSEIVRQSEVAGQELFIGRNASNGVHLPDLAVNPVHARVERRGGELVITSQSQQPFDVDGRSVESATVDITRGAELRFGGHIIVVASEGDAVTLTVRRIEAVSDSAEEKDEAAIYSLKGLLPGKRMSAWGFALLVLIACLAWPVYTWSSYKDLAYKEKVSRPAGFHADGLWSSGKMSQAHKTLKDDCQACHVDAFVSVRDNACLTCHEKDAGPHAPMTRQLTARGDPTGFAAFTRFVAASFNKPAGRCVECHTEHEGAGAMQPTQQRFCAECHDGMDTRLTNTKLDNAADFGKAAAQTVHPRLFGMGVHPLDAHLDRRMVLDDQCRAIGLFGQPCAQPLGADLAKGSPVTAFFQRIEHQQADRPCIDLILHEPVDHRHIGKLSVEGVALIVIAQAHMDRERADRERGLEPPITVLVAAVDQVSGGEQHVRQRIEIAQHGDDLVQPLAIELSWVVRIEAQMDIGNLSNQHPGV